MTLRTLLSGGDKQENQSLITRVRKNPFRYLVLILCTINIALIVVNAGVWIIAAYQKLFVAADFTSFYTGYYMVRVGEGSNLYDPALQSTLQQQFMKGLSFEGGVLLFPNPPHVAVAFSPLSLLPIESAFYVWTLLQLALLAWILIRLNRLFSHWEKQERVILMISILAFWPLANTLLLGQFSLFLLLALVQMYIDMRSLKLTQAGLWMFILSIKPHTLFLPLTMVLNRRFWRVALGLLVMSIFFFITTTLIIGFRPWMEYLQSLLALGSYYGEFGVTPTAEYTIRGMLANILGNSQGNLINIISIFLLLLGMAFTWLLWRRNTHQDHPRFMLYFAFTIILSVFLSLHLNPHDALVLVVPAALFYDYLRLSGFPKKAYAVLLLVSPSVFLFGRFSEYGFFGVIRPPVLVIIVLLAWMLRYMFFDHGLLKNQDSGISESTISS